MQIYQPQIRHTVVNEINPPWCPPMIYNHDADVVVFKGRYFCAWNANPLGADEGKGSQFNFLSVSDDFENWSTPFRPFCSDGGAINPEDTDGQWQPNFINFRDERLFCDWRRDGGEGDPVHIISHSDDGLKWTNTVQSPCPAELDGRGLFAFPTNRGLLTRGGVMLFPNSICPGLHPFWPAPYGAMMRSEDGGKTWNWGAPFEAVTWPELGEDPAFYSGMEQIPIWEPVAWEKPDGTLGVMIRTAPPADGSWKHTRAEHMILTADSGDEGKTWTRARPIEVESVTTRQLVLSLPDEHEGLLMVTNDWLPERPRIFNDRYFLSLYLAPVNDPDLLLPGPVIAPLGATAHYPNGQVHDGTLYTVFSYGNKPRAIYGSATGPLPDFSAPFLLPRGRTPQVAIEDGIARFEESSSSLGLILTADLTRQPNLTLSFRARLNTVHAHWCGEGTPILTLGGKTHSGMCLRVFDMKRLQVKIVGEDWADVGEVALREWLDFTAEMTPQGFAVAATGVEKRFCAAPLLRKISFGGLYWPPVNYPTSAQWLLDTKTIRLT